MKADTTIDWENKPVLCLNPQKKQQAIRFGIAILVLVTCAIGFKLWADETIPTAVKQYENDHLKSEMSIKANEGKMAAQLWMAEHYPDEHTTDELNTLIEQGNAEAMMTKAQLVYPTDKTLATSLLNQAAQEGHPDAIRYLSDKKSSDISFMEFITQYLFNGD